MDALDLDEIATALDALMMDEEEVQVYLRLLRTGPAKASSLDPFFEMSRSKLYRLLDGIVEQGYASKSLERPTLYQAVAPEEAFEVARSSLERDLDRLDAARSQHLEDLATLASQDGKPPEHHWTKIEGASRIYETLHRMVEDADTSFWAASNHEVSLSTYLPAVEEAWRLVFERAETEALDARILFDFQGDAVSALPEGVELPESVQTRRFTSPETVHFVLVDGEDLLMWVRPAPLGSMSERDDVAVRTNAPGSVFAHRLLFEQLWSEAEPVDVLP